MTATGHGPTTISRGHGAFLAQSCVETYPAGGARAIGARDWTPESVDVPAPAPDELPRAVDAVGCASLT